MNKKSDAFLIAIPAFILLTFFKIIPAVMTIMISFKNINIMKGIGGSESAGLSFYAKLFQNNEFLGIIRNTVVISLLSILFTCILAVLLISCISRLPNWIMKTVAVTILAIPAFIPAVAFSSVFMDFFSIEGSLNSILSSVGSEPRLFFAEPGLYPFLAALMNAIRSVYIPVILGVLVRETGNRQPTAGRTGFVILGYIAARAMMLLSPEVESILLTSNPMTIRNSDVIDTYVYRLGLMTMQYSVASAVWVIKIFLQLVISVAFFFILYYLVPRITENVERLGEGPKTVSGSILGIVGFVIFGAASFIMIIMTLIPAGGDIGKGLGVLLNDNGFIVALSNSLIFGITSCIIYGIVSLMLALPMRFSKIIYPLLLVIVFSLSNNFIGELLFYKNFGLFNTIYPNIINSALSVAGAFALHFSVSCRLKGASCSFGQYFKTALAPLVVIVILTFISSWGSYLYQNIFTTTVSMNGIGIYVSQRLTSLAGISTESVRGIQQNPSDIRAALIFISSVVPAALGALLIFLNKFLPLTAFSAHIRKG